MDNDKKQELVSFLECYKYTIAALGQIAMGKVKRPDLYAAAIILGIKDYDLEWDLVGGKPENKKQETK